MESGDHPFAAMRQFEEAWPRIERQERKFRRSDLIAVTINAVCGLVLIVYSAFVPRGIATGFIVGAVFAIGYGVGRMTQAIAFRRRSFDQLRELHEHASFTLAYHHGDDDG